MEISIYLFGAGGHCKVIIDCLLASKNYLIENVIDHNPKTMTVLDIPVIHFDDFGTFENKPFIVSIGDNKSRKNVAEEIQSVFLSIIHPKAIVSVFSSISEGTVVLGGAIINADSTIGKHCIINTGAIIEHDCFLGDFVHISPNASISGNVTIGEGSHIGTGASVIQGITIGKWAVIGAGSVIIKDVPDYAVVVGNPGRIIKLNN